MLLRALGSTGRLLSRTRAPAHPRSASLRLLSSKSGGDKDADADAASIFLSDESSLPSPPSYVRDAVTGKWTSDTLAEISAGDRRLLRLDGEDRDEELVARAGRRLAGPSAAGPGPDGADDGLGAAGGEHVRIAGRIQEEELALGPIGRDPAGGLAGEDGAESAEDERLRVDRPLSPRELQALKTYAQREHGVHPSDFARLASDDPDLIPHNSGGDDGGGPGIGGSAKQGFDADLDLAYLNPALSRRAADDHGAGSGGSDDDPFADLLPSDLAPSRKVNRRNARPLPRALVHHNNLSLLRRYSTPGGKIMNRVQSRLGAKDQRKVARAIKRARHLGLVPHIGQWKLEDHGSLQCGGDGGKSDWEAELERRGLWPISDDSELFRKYYDVEGVMRHVGGPRGDGRREELEELLRGVGGMERRLAEEGGGGGAGRKTGEGDASSS